MDAAKFDKHMEDPPVVRVPSRENFTNQLGLWQLWRSLPRPCKLFLVVCLVQSIVSGAFASVELSREGTSNLQDLLLILISAIYFFGLVLDAFFHENGYQLLVCMASGALNLVQLIVYASSLRAGRDSTSLSVVVACALLQAIAVGLARWAYLGFGWRMYSKIAGDMRLPDIDRRRRVGLRLDRFSALAKLDVQLMCLLLVVGVVNGANPSGSEVLTPLIIVAAVGVTGAAAWLAACWTAVATSRPRLSLAAEFTYPLCYIVSAAYMFSSVYYGTRLAQIHGQVYLIVIPILFLAWRTSVWWDARLLSASGLLAGPQRLDAPHAAGQPRKRGMLGVTDGMGGPAPAKLDGKLDAAAQAAQNQMQQQQAQVPPDILPLVHGAWLLKLPSVAGASASPTKRVLGLDALSAAGRAGGRWRYFQLSHDGSTLRWDWRKYVLLLHVEGVSANTQDLTITLSLTLEPDLRLKFPDAEMHATWARGLTLLVMLLGNPDGLEGRASRRLSVGSKDPSGAGLVADPGSPSRILHRLASASARASAGGLLTKEALQVAASQARRALGDHSEPASPFYFAGKEGDLEKGSLSVGGEVAGAGGAPIGGVHKVIAVHATSVQRPGSANLRQRTPSKTFILSDTDNGAGSGNANGSDPRVRRRDSRKLLPGEASASPSPSKNNRKNETTASWLKRTLTAPVSTLAAGVSRQLTFSDSLQHQQSINTVSSSGEGDIEAPVGGNNGGGGGINSLNGIYTSTTAMVPPPPVPSSYGAIPHAAISVPHRSRHLRSASLGSEGCMPPVPEGCGSFTPAAPLPPPAPLHQGTPGSGARAGAAAGSGGGGGDGVYHMVAMAGRYPRGKSSSPASGGKPTPPTRNNRGGSPLKPVVASGSGAALAGTAFAAVSQGPPIFQQPLARYSSAPMHFLQHEMSGIDIADFDAAAAQLQAMGSGIQRMGSDGSSWQVGSAGGSQLARFDSLGAQWAPGSKLWQAMFDAGMVASYGGQGSYGMAGGSTEGSPSPTATPHSVRSVARSVAINVELIDFEQLSFGRMLGEGAEGPVYAAWFQETPVAVKRASCPTEVDLHLHAGWHDNVVNLRGLAQHGGHTYLVMELCPRGTLDVLIHQGNVSAGLDPAKLLPIVRSIARGMLHLHTRSPPVMHRDLKPANIFIGHGFVMKIGDFGMARYGADTRAARAAQAHVSPSKFGTGAALRRTLTPGVIGTAAYCAPELLQPVTPKAGDLEAFDAETLLRADVYSFGVLLWELLERKRPYSGMDGFQIQTQWVLDPESMKLKPPKVPEGLAPPARRVMATLVLLVQKCTAWDPEDRPTFKEILATLRAAATDGDAPPTPLRHLASPF